MKEKEPNRSIFSADESPVPLPSVEEAWSDMRKRLDEEMPERAVFFWFRRGTLLVLFLLLSLAAFLLIRRTGGTVRPAAGGTIVRAKNSGRDAQPNAATDQGKGGVGDRRIGEAGDRRGEKESEQPNRTSEQSKGAAEQPKGPGVGRHAEKELGQPNSTADQAKERLGDRSKGGLTDQQNEGVAHQRKEGNGAGEMPAMAVSGKLRSASGSARNNKLRHTTQKNDISHAGSDNEQTDATGSGNTRTFNARTGNEKARNSKPGNTRPGIVRTNDPQRAVIDPRLAQTGTADPIRVQVDMPRKTAKTGKKNAPTPEQPKRSAKEDSTRILWAAGLQDRKSFPVGAQQAYNYDANLKKDLWADYIPSPYFQYHISRKIGFQAALQLNDPQYTESVTIFRKAGDSSGGVQVINDTTVMVRKLYYFNIPFIVYYSPLRHVYLGAGLQFSNLRNGIAFQNNIIHHVGGSSLTDTVTTSTVISLKENRPAYNNLRKTDWRAIFELNYYWKRITLGLQYQQALGNYLYTPVEGSSGRDRNSSFNIYLRYNLWERRIKITPTH